MNIGHDKKRYIIFYPGDWLSDMKLNLCSLITHGAWMRLICIMHESEEYGYLMNNGKALSPEEIKTLIKITDEEFEIVWHELTKNQVLKLDKNTGAYFSKRMVQDYKKIMQNQQGEYISPENLKIIELTLIHLNKKANTLFNHKDKSHIKIINSKILEGYTLKDFIKVIDIKCDEWLEQEKMLPFLRPSTLFGNKFYEYISQKQKNQLPKPTHKSNPYNDMRK